MALFHGLDPNALNNLLSQITLWDANQSSNPIVQAAMANGKSGITLGPNQYYRNLPNANDNRRIVIIGVRRH